MEVNKILDYEQVEEKLEELCTKYRGIINKESDLGITLYGLPIRYYIIGTGSKDIVITGATHGAEIITTDFILQLMEEMAKNGRDFKLDEFKFHIVPMLNPEGYLISTSAVRSLIPRSMNLIDAEKICKEYYLAYKSDDQEALDRQKNNIFPDRFSVKKHQKMFENVDYTCIDIKYKNIRDRVKNIIDNYPDLPKGCIVTWDANASGIDVQANSIFNRRGIHNALYNEHSYGNRRYENIDCSHPGPINCPVDSRVGFYETAELKAISGLLKRLHENGNLVSYENFHSTGGLIYQRPSRGGNGISIEDDLYWKKVIFNFFMALSYADGTFKDCNDKENSKYKILTDSDLPSSSNALFRIMYPADLLIELSGMGGNPIGPYGDINGNYKNIIESNINAYKGFINNFTLMDKASSNLLKYMNVKYNGIANSVELQDFYINEIYEHASRMMSVISKYVKEGKVDKLNELFDLGETFLAEEIKNGTLSR